MTTPLQRVDNNDTMNAKRGDVDALVEGFRTAALIFLRSCDLFLGRPPTVETKKERDERFKQRTGNTD